MSAKYKSPSFLLPNEINTNTNPLNTDSDPATGTGVNSLYSMDFDGTEYINAGQTLNIYGSQPRTISCWFNINSFATTSSGDGSNLLGYGTGTPLQAFSIAVTKYPNNPNHRIFLHVWNAAQDISGTTQILENNWYLATVTYDGSTLKLYLNGNLEGSSSTSSLNTATSDFIIGQGVFSTWNTLNGKIDEVAVFNRALDSTEISALYGGTSPNIYPSNLIASNLNPIAYYPLGEQAQNTGYLDPNNPGSDMSGSEWQFPNGVLQDYVMDFDGSDDLINLNDNILFNSGSPFSCSFWCNVDSYSSNTAYPGIFTLKTNQSTGFMMFLSTVGGYTGVNFGSNLSFYRGKAGSASDIPVNTWLNIILTYDGVNSASSSSYKIFINGDSKSISGSGGYSAVPNVNRIGKSDNNHFDGKLSNVQFFNTVLPETGSNSVETLYNNGSPLTDMSGFTSLTNWWKLNADSVYTPSAPNYTKALSFGGTDYIDCGVVSAVENVSSFSMSVWVYPTNSGSKSIIGNWGNPYVGVQINTSSSKVDFFVDDSTTLGGYGSTSAGLSNNNWAHLVLVFDGSGSGNSGRLKGYINGVEQTLSYTGTIPATTAAPNRAFRIGDQHVYYGLIGNISNAAIWNTPLSASQVSTLFNFGTPETNISFSPISWWKLDNLTTGLLDSGSASNNGTNNGATDISSGVAVTPSWKIPSALPIPTINYTTALDFVSSESDYIQIPYNTNLTPQNGNFTISAWINTDNLSGWHPIWSTQNLSSGTKVVALHTYDNKVRATVGGSTNNPSYAGSWALFLDSTQSLITSTWYHIAVTFNMSGNAQIYINGSADNSGPIENPQTSWDTGDRFIGDGEGFWDGRISNISIFNTALGQPDITSLYNNGTPLSDMSSFTSLVSWWKLDTGGSTITDYGSGGNNGTNNGAALVTSDVFSGVIPSNGVSTTLPSTALQQSDLQFDSPYSNYSLSFDGAGDYIDCTDNDMFSFGNGATDLPFSISTWVNFVDVTDSMILSKHTTGQFEYSFLVMANDKLIFQLNSQLGSSLISRYYNTTITSYEGQWIHLVGTYDGSRSASGIKIYLNGTRVDDNDFISGTYVAMNNGTAPVEIGKRSTDYMNGKIDETAIFNTELTSAQILEIYNNGRPKDLSTFSGTAPISWWRLGENAYFDNNSFVVPNSISGAPNGTGSGSITTMISADAPGTYANGIGTNLNILDRVGDAALSTSNSQSYNIIPSDISPYVPQYVGDQIANNFSMTFDGVNDYINVGNPTELQLTGAFSVSLWMKTNITGSRVIISKDSNTSNPRGFSVGFNNTYPGGYFVIFNGTTVYGAYINTSTPNYVDIRNDQWHHIVGVYTPSTSVALFIDGNLIQSNTTNIPASVNFVNDNLNIGRKPQSGGINYYQGELDEVAIFDTALNADQIKFDLYQPSLPAGTNKTADIANNPNLPTPVAWYRMGD